ncbi:dihydroxy-acid dehydratase [Amycolatopsis rhabdoformis]|uniref:Dihydroxy-acid dehydratase n=1 Tax=Amycolatopsis rhabdoformis TaxID=1448059 RepID=A0ABZ1IDZ2_9PSEU|nr:dihydroxy-acid dehydratase [Amycolatopsis rhabdoformis]WSE31898.1 dihydroxy-acid dehydratase [Amycolatopsis rhabdoformis]
MRPADGGFDRTLTHYGDRGFSSFVRRAFLKSAGYDAADQERPVIGIAHGISDYTTCHRHMPEVVEAVKRGVLEAGGLPMAFPTMSLPEILLSPTSMLFRNLLAMEVEELLLAQPMDAAVLVGGCDKTLPGQLMGALSADLPFVALPVGPMSSGSWEGRRVGACTDCRQTWQRFRAGELDEEQVADAQGRLCPDSGTCMVMGTASTMACLSEVLGFGLPGSGTPRSGSGARLRAAVATGRRAVEIARERLTPRSFLSEASFRNAITALYALGGSTNAVIHLLAIAGRAGIPLSLTDFASLTDDVPVLVDVKPVGTRFLGDLDEVGGVPVVVRALADRFDLSARTVTGQTWAAQVADVPGVPPWQDVVRPLDAPVKPAPGMKVVFGSLAPDGAVIKTGAADPRLLKHRGPALVFDSVEEAEERLSDPDLAVTPDHVLVLRNIGPVASGMPEAGSLPIPTVLARQGVKDMVRVSDGRMSGTAYGTTVLHCAPEAAVGGPLSLVRDGDEIELDVAAGRIDLLVSEEDLRARTPAPPPSWLATTRWRRVFTRSVGQAGTGADLVD